MPGGRGGGFAEYAVAPARLLAAKPARLTFAEAAAVPMAGLTAQQALRDMAGLQAGERVLIHGASGGVGTFAAQIIRGISAFNRGRPMSAAFRSGPSWPSGSPTASTNRQRWCASSAQC